MADQKLMQYFKFNDADLRANRNGYLSDKQKEFFKSNLELGSSGKVIVIFVALAILVAASQPMVKVVQSNANTSPISWGLAAIWLIVALAIDGWLLRRLRLQGKYQLDKVKGRARIVTTSGERNSTYYELQIGGQEFQVDAEITHVIEEGQEYMIYYIKPNKDIVSAEVSSAAE